MLEFRNIDMAIRPNAFMYKRFRDNKIGFEMSVKIVRKDEAEVKSILDGPIMAYCNLRQSVQNNWFSYSRNRRIKKSESIGACAFHLISYDEIKWIWVRSKIVG